MSKKKGELDRLLKYVTGLLLTLVFVLSGCDAPSASNDASEERQSEWSENVSKQDQLFIGVLREKAITVNQMAEELEADLQAMQGDDELHDAADHINLVRQDVLFHWNQLHNDYQPQHPKLQKMQDDLEALLIDYRAGLSTEIVGMETGDALKMKEGFQKTTQARQSLRQFQEQVNTVFTR